MVAMTTQETGAETNGKRERAKSLGIGTESRELPLSRIRIPKSDQFGDFNARHDSDLEDKKVSALWEQIREQGLLTPLTVKEVFDEGDAEPWYEIQAGFRRLAALRLGKVRGTVACRVIRAAKPYSGILVNLGENTGREDLHPADLACRLAQLETGMYPGAREASEQGGGMPDMVPRAEIASATGLSLPYVGNLSRAWIKLCPRIREEWRSRRVAGRGISTDLAVKWAKLSEEEQIGMFEAWLVEQKAKKTDKADKKQKAKKQKETREGGATKYPPKSRGEIRTVLAKFQDKLDNVKLSPRDVDVANAKIDALRWVAGDLNRLTLT